jgi:hypothetical protein
MTFIFQSLYDPRRTPPQQDRICISCGEKKEGYTQHSNPYRQAVGTSDYLPDLRSRVLVDPPLQDDVFRAIIIHNQMSHPIGKEGDK